MPKKHNLISCLIILSLLLGLSFCRNGQKADQIHELAVKSSIPEGTDNVRLIFYNMYLPPRMSKIFERVGANYNPSILNNPDDFARYQDPHKTAINLGIYGVDMSYVRMFDQTLLMAKYFSTIQLLTRMLDIPDEYFDDMVKGIEHSSNNRDSLIRIASEIYDRTDNYLKKNDNDAYAALIVTGGWIETMYISTRILEADPDNVEISDRIAEQKYSLNSLISLLSNYQEDISVAGDLLLLKLLKRSFDRYDIYYEQDNFVLDTVNKLISASGCKTGITPEILDEITDIVGEIRTQMIN